MRTGKLARHGGSQWRWRVSPGGLIRTLLSLRGAIETPLLGRSGDDLRLIRDTRSLVPLLVNDASALQLLICARAARSRQGAMAEAGVLAGGSARLICEAKGPATLYLFDVFETLQLASADAVSPLERQTRSHFGRVCSSRADVEQLLSPYPGVEIREGLFPTTIAGLEQETFSFVHLDLDLATTTLAALEFFVPRLVQGGILIGDDYHLPELRDVFDRFCQSRPDTVFRLPWGQIMMVKHAA